MIYLIIISLVIGCFLKIIKISTVDKNNNKEIKIPVITNVPEVKIKTGYKLYDCECSCKMCEENGYNCFEDMEN